MSSPSSSSASPSPAKDDDSKKKKSYLSYDFMSYHFLDAYGNLKAMEEDGGMKTEAFLREGLSIDGSSIAGMASVENSDIKVQPEPDTFLSFQVNDLHHHRFMCHFEMEQQQQQKQDIEDNENGADVSSAARATTIPHPCDPRNILKRQVDTARGMGYEPYMFSEVEFYLVDEATGQPADQGTYCSLPPDDKSSAFRQQLGRICKDQCHMKVKRIHHEVGPGQNEIELNLTPSLKNADDTTLCMWIMKLLAGDIGQRVLFDPKPLEGQAGNGMHHHILLRDVATGKNVFQTSDVSDKLDLSDTCKHGIAGLIKYADDITAAFAASQQTFERLKPGYEAPIFKTWGYSNRTCLVRVPQTTDPDLTRFEYRGGDLSGSVHIFGAVLLAAVLAGIRDKLEVPPPSDFNVEAMTPEQLATEHNIYPVPLTFEKCIDVLRSSQFLHDALGPEMVQLLIERDEAALKEEVAAAGGGKHHHHYELVPTSMSALTTMKSTLHDVVETAKHIVFHQ